MSNKLKKKELRANKKEINENEKNEMCSKIVSKMKAEYEELQKPQ